MQVSGTPLKFLIPFAANDVNKVEIPTTTASPGRASQSLGFPPLTMQPPESGGLPPQGEDFNGAMNQIARVAWWMMAGGAFPFDAAFAAGVSPAGYPQGAAVPSADLLGWWISTADNNSANPDTTGTGWVPGGSYGTLALTGLTNANVTLTPAQAAKARVTLTGTLTGNVQIVVPAWLKDWTYLNNTTGAFTVTVKTPAGAGIVVPQNGAPTLLTGDGTNITQLGQNIGAATASTQGAQVAQLHSAYATRGLLAQNNTTTPNTQIDVSANIVVLRNAASGALTTFVNTGVLTNNVSVNAVNGRDQVAAFTASTWVRLYFVKNGAALATVTSANAPTTGPTGYADWAYAGSFYFNASSQLVRTGIAGSRAYYAAAAVAVFNGGAATETLVNVSTLVPPEAEAFTVSGQSLNGTTDATGTLRMQQNIGFITGQVCDVKAVGGSAITNTGSQLYGSCLGNVDVPNIGQKYYYSTGITTGTLPQATQNITGYKVPNGGE